MTYSEATFNLETLPKALRTLSSGSDGDALVGVDEFGHAYELRVMGSASTDRIKDIQRQIALIALADHPCIRVPIETRFQDRPPTFRFEIPPNIDPLADRLSTRLSELNSENRLMLAAVLAETSAHAHQLGLFHGSFDASSILIDSECLGCGVFIDYSTMSINQSHPESHLSLEDDLAALCELLTVLLEPVLLSGSKTESQPLSGRNRAMLMQWMKSTEAECDRPPPTVGQWRSILDRFLPDERIDQTSQLDHTGLLPAPKVPVGSGSTSRLGQTHLPDHLSSRDIPNQLGRFRIDAKIGEGGMGTVYRGIDLTNGQSVAVKVLRATGKDIAQAIRRFRKEARLLRDVQNSHVTRLIDVGQTDGLHYLVMEYVRGTNLKSWLANRSGLEESDAIGLMIDLARSLVQAHAGGVIHRDIKPENVLLERHDDASNGNGPDDLRPISDFTIKLTDFGIARHVDQTESMDMTRAGSIMGTPKYMSPEQCKSSRELSPAADVYALGVMMFELLTGKVPFESDDFMKIAAKHCFDPVPSIQKENARITDSADRIIRRALAKDPSDRFGDASQILSELIQLQRGESSSWQAHPKLPVDRSQNVWEKTVSWDLENSTKQLWPLVSNTERLNEAIGLPAVQYRTEHDPMLGTRRFGSFTVSGMQVSWEEHPFEWIEGHRMGVLREFSTGPLKWYSSVVTLEPNSTGGTRLSHQLRVESRNWLGRVMTAVKMDRQGFRNLQRVYSRIDQSLTDRMGDGLNRDPFAEPKPISPRQKRRLSDATHRVIQSGVDPKVAAKLETAIETWSPQELAKLRPLQLADRLGIRGETAIDACLIAASEGILNLRWDVLCPTCRVAADTKEELSQIGKHTNCEACNVDFQSDLSAVIEMVFQIHAEIRTANAEKYCIGGPVHSPHVASQVRVDVAERLDVTLDLDIGDYLIRGPDLPRTQSLIVRSSAAPSSIDQPLSQIGVGNHILTLRRGRQTITFDNDLDRLHIIRIERTIPRSDIVTAAMASTNPLFRMLFPNQQFLQDRAISTENLTFLTTRVNNIDELYSSLGDTKAYAMIRRLHETLGECIRQSGGTVVKEVGESILTAFPLRDQAVGSVQTIRNTINKFDVSIELGIGIHCGPALVTTQNNQLDYFGGTVRAVTALTDHAGGDTLITEAVYVDPTIPCMLTDAGNLVESIDLPGHPNMRTKRLPSRERT